MNPLRTCIRELYDIRSSKAITPGTVSHPSMSALLTAIDKTLKPQFWCIINLTKTWDPVLRLGTFRPRPVRESRRGTQAREHSGP
jgi:hypothetical protein